MKKEWPKVRLAAVLRLRKEFVTIDDLTTYRRPRVQLHAQGIVLRDEVPGALIKTKQQQVCRAGEFLVAEIDAKIGGFSVVPEALDGSIVSSHYFLFDLDEAKLDRRFLKYFISTPGFREQVAAQGSTNYAAIRPADVLGYEIPLPPLAEQRRVVARIEDLAAQIHEARTVHQQATEEGSVLYEQARDRAFKSLRCEWRMIAELFDLVNGRAFKPEDWQDTGRKIIRIQNLKYPTAPFNHFRGWVHPKHLVNQGDVLFAWSGQVVSLGAHIWCGEEAVLNQHIFNVKSKGQLLPAFVKEALNALIDKMKEEVRGLEMFHIRKQELDRFLFPCPPPPVQRRIVAELQALQAEVGALKRLQAEIATEVDVMLPAILDRAVKGEL